MRVRFLRRFRWVVPERRGRVALVFKPGEKVVRRVCGEAAVAAGAAVLVSREGSSNGPRK
jgi:hypothetical protein